MKCHKCGEVMKYMKGLKFNEFKIDGWKCRCGEIYYDPEQAQRVLLINKLKKEKVITKLGKIRSNLIVRLPKDIENAFNLEKGEKVSIKVDQKGLRIEVV